MIDKIKKAIEGYYNMEEKRGVFLTGYKFDKSIVLSSGVITSDKSLHQVIEMIYHGLMEKHTEIQYISCDIIKESAQTHSMEEIIKVDMQKYGICASNIDHSKSGIVLPGTIGIHNSSEALSFIKSKYKLSGNILIYIFTTQRFYIQ